ncbi:MAG: hypothetical protein AAGH81_00375 [Bacteroidota bacterium]
MNRKYIVFSATLLFGIGVWAQETKTYKETFNVGDGTVLEINTSHTDIEFETWDKDQVEIVATVTLNEATKEEAQDYFENDPFKIVGNSREIEISTVGRNFWDFALAGSDFDFHFDMEPLFLDLEIPDLPELAVIPELAVMPPLPPLNFKNFDYDQYREEGMDYLKEWAESFQEGFDEEYEERMEEWGKRVEERAKAWEERNAERLKEREKLMEERAKEMEKRAEEHAKRVEERAREMEERRKARMKARGKDSQGLFFSSEDNDGPNIFYFSSDGENKKYKVKKTIKIKMPKSVKLKMNVKHGEVKLAVSMENINASLRYASLLASTVNGDDTLIEASYTPMVISNWNNGDMKLKYCDNVKLGEVRGINLNSVSSNVIINRVNDDLHLINDFGRTEINTISPDSKRIFVRLKNGEFYASPPKGEYNLYLFDDYSNISYPKDLKVNKRNQPFGDKDFITAGPTKGQPPFIIINSRYSEVVLEE